MRLDAETALLTLLATAPPPPLSSMRLDAETALLTLLATAPPPLSSP